MKTINLFLVANFFCIFHCCAQKKDDTIVKIENLCYYINDQKKTICELSEIFNRNIRVTVENDTPLFMIDSLLNKFDVTCYNKDMCISFLNRSYLPLGEITSGTVNELKDDIIYDTIYSDCNENYGIVREIKKESIFDYIKLIDDAETIITIKNKKIQINGKSYKEGSEITQPILLQFNNENTFEDLMSAYSILMKQYRVKSCHDLYNRSKIINCFYFDQQIYKSVIKLLYEKKYLP